MPGFADAIAATTFGCAGAGVLVKGTSVRMIADDGVFAAALAAAMGASRLATEATPDWTAAECFAAIGNAAMAEDARRSEPSAAAIALEAAA